MSEIENHKADTDAEFAAREKGEARVWPQNIWLYDDPENPERVEVVPMQIANELYEALCRATEETDFRADKVLAKFERLNA